MPLASIIFTSKKLASDGYTFSTTGNCPNDDASSSPALNQFFDKLVYLCYFFKCFQHQLLRGLADIVRRFYFIIHSNDISRWQKPFLIATQPIPRLSEGLHHHQIWIFGQFLYKRSLPGKIDISFIHYYDARNNCSGLFQCLHDERNCLSDYWENIERSFSYDHRLAFQWSSRSSWKAGVKQNLPFDLHIIDISTYFIHTISGRTNDHIIFSGFTKCHG